MRKEEVERILGELTKAQIIEVVCESLAGDPVFEWKLKAIERKFEEAARKQRAAKEAAGR